MARTIRDAVLENRTNRLKLKPGRRLFKSIHDGLALSYRRTRDGFGVWSVRIRQSNGKYALERIGMADDFANANDATVLNFTQAQRKSQERYSSVKKFGGIIRDDITVATASTDYLAWFRTERKSVRATQITIDAHILPAFGDRTVASLTTREIRHWHSRLAVKPARKRSRIGQRTAYRELPQTDDAKRSRKATANRVLTVFKAILNKAYLDETVSSRDAWTRVQPFANADQAVTRFLRANEAIRLLNACARDLRSLVRAALLTGARYSELTQMKVGDFAADTRAVFIHPSKSGKGRHVPLNKEGLAFFRSLSTGKEASQHLFTRVNGNPWGTNHHVRSLADACTRAKIEPAVTFHELRHSYASLLAQAGADLLTISKLLGHADTRVTARHYAHLCDKTLANAVNALLPSFGTATASNLVDLVNRPAA